MTGRTSPRVHVRHPAAIIAFCCAALVGCQAELELIPVHGKVLFRGQPLKYGGVMFQPHGNGLLARGTIQSDGTFVLGTESADDGVRPGKCRVRITAFAAQKPGAQTNSQQELALGNSAIPAKYHSFGTSGVVVVVKPDMELPLVIELD
jgi:hypothetical protein